MNNAFVSECVVVFDKMIGGPQHGKEHNIVPTDYVDGVSANAENENYSWILCDKRKDKMPVIAFAYNESELDCINRYVERKME